MTSRMVSRCLTFSFIGFSAKAYAIFATMTLLGSGPFPAACSPSKAVVQYLLHHSLELVGQKHQEQPLLPFSFISLPQCASHSIRRWITPTRCFLWFSCVCFSSCSSCPVLTRRFCFSLLSTAFCTLSRQNSTFNVNSVFCDSGKLSEWSWRQQLPTLPVATRVEIQLVISHISRLLAHL